MYLSYDDYKSYGGTLDETTFNDYNFEATYWIDWYTFKRLASETTLSDSVKRCTYKLITIAKTKADLLALGMQSVQTVDSAGKVTSTTTTTPAISSQSNDGVSISYNVISASAAFQELIGAGARKQGNEIENTINMYLYGVRNSLGQLVLFRGRYPNE